MDEKWIVAESVLACFLLNLLFVSFRCFTIGVFVPLCVSWHVGNEGGYGDGTDDSLGTFPSQWYFITSFLIYMLLQILWIGGGEAVSYSNPKRSIGCDRCCIWGSVGYVDEVLFTGLSERSTNRVFSV